MNQLPLNDKEKKFPVQIRSALVFLREQGFPEARYHGAGVIYLDGTWRDTMCVHGKFVNLSGAYGLKNLEDLEIAMLILMNTTPDPNAEEPTP